MSPFSDTPTGHRTATHGRLTRAMSERAGPAVSEPRGDHLAGDGVTAGRPMDGDGSERGVIIPYDRASPSAFLAR